MSIDALNWAKHRRVGQTGRKATLIVVADIANHHGVAYATVDYFADVCECHRDTVIAHLQRLEDDGHIVRVPRFRADGAPTSTLTVLGAGLAASERGNMLPEGEDPENGVRILRHLQALTKSGFSATKSENPTSGSSETKSGFTPDQVGIPDTTRPYTRPSDPSPSSAARASGESEQTARPPLPATGEHLDELTAYLDGVAQWANVHTDKKIRRFASAWFGDGSEQRRVRDLLEPEIPAVRLGLVDYVARRAAAGWTSPGVANAIAGRVLSNERDTAARAAAGGKTAAQREDEHDELTRQREAEAAAYMAQLAGQPADIPAYDFEAQAVEVPDHGAHQ